MEEKYCLSLLITVFLGLNNPRENIYFEGGVDRNSEKMRERKRGQGGGDVRIVKERRLAW